MQPHPAQRRIDAAALLLLLYGLTVLVHALSAQLSLGFSDVPGFVRALIRGLGFALLAYGVHTRRAWAWWFSLGLSVIFLSASLAVLGVFGLLWSAGASTLGTAPQASALIVALISLLELLGASLLLLTPAVRRAFRASPA